MAIDNSRLQGLQSAVAGSLHQHWKFYLVEGICLLILGLFAILIPNLASIAVEILIGWVVLLSGVVGLITTFRMRGAPGFGWSLLSAVIAIAAGVDIAAVAAFRRRVAHLYFDGVLAGRGHCLDHAGLAGAPRIFRALGDASLQRRGRLVLGSSHLPGAPRDRRLGHRTARRHQYGVWRYGPDFDGAARTSAGASAALASPQAVAVAAARSRRASMSAASISQSRNCWTSRRGRCGRSGATRKYELSSAKSGASAYTNRPVDR